MPGEAPDRGHRIVESKLAPGLATPDALARPRLDPPAAFVDGTAAVALLSAPAGYGKTTVMSAWAERLRSAPLAVAWLSLDADDNDPARFLRHLVAALSAIRPSIGRDVLAQISGLQSGSIKGLVESLATDLGLWPQRAVLFLDDLHFVTSHDVLEVIHWLLHYAPSGWQFVLGSRGEPRLKLSNLRVRRRLSEFRASDLALDADEAARFFERRLGRPLGHEALAKLMGKTEGWPAALELVAAALRLDDDADDLIRRFAGTDRSVVDYLGETVLGSLESSLRQLVERLALFDRFNVELGARLTGAHDVGDAFRTLQDRHFFLVPLDRHGRWFRFHHLVSDYLREHAIDDAAAVLSTGARWLREQGEHEAAIQAAIRARDFDFAAETLSICVEELVHGRGYHQMLAQWMREIPEASTDRFPQIRLGYVFSLAFQPGLNEVDLQLHRLGEMASRMERAPDADATTIGILRCSEQMQVAILQALRDQGRAALATARAWTERWPDAPSIMKGHVANVLAFGLKTAGDLDGAMRTIAQARRWHAQAESHYGMAWSVFIEALLMMKRGSYREARQVCESGLEMIQRHLGGHRTHTSLLQTVLAATAYEFDEPAQAEAHLAQAMHSVQDHGPADAVILACLTQARLKFLAGEDASAFAILSEGQSISAKRGLDRVVITLAAEECTWLGRRGRHDEAHEAALRSGILRVSDRGDGTDGLLADKSTRVALRLQLQRVPREVEDTLQAAADHCERAGFQHRRAEVLGMAAIAAGRRGDLATALGYLDASLRVAAPRQYLRTYIDEGAEVGELVRRMAESPGRHAETLPFARRLLRAIERTAPAARPTLKDGLRGELTDREIKLLKRLESGMSNREIAESVFITEGTLKWHLTNIYSKLGVKNRSGALVRAREFALI